MVTTKEVRDKRARLLAEADKVADQLAARASGAASKNIVLVLMLGQFRAQARALDWVLGEGEI